jgi:hypothetical protein
MKPAAMSEEEEITPFQPHQADYVAVHNRLTCTMMTQALISQDRKLTPINITPPFFYCES